MPMFDAVLSPEGLAALLALTAMEIVLGVDNVVFISVLVSRLPKDRQEQARRFGLMLALVLRVLMLLAVTTLLALTQPLVTIAGFALSWRDIILIGGGLFLVVKATHEMHVEAEGGAHLGDVPVKPTHVVAAVLQIGVINLVFSIDSTMTAIGMARDVTTMVVAVVVSMVAMYYAAGFVSSFLRRHPAAKQLALAFLMLIGVVLVSEGVHQPIDRRILYAAIAFTILVEFLAMAGARRRRRQARRREMLRRQAFQAAAGETPSASDKARS